jgi:hypothetical protein
VEHPIRAAIDEPETLRELHDACGYARPRAATVHSG